MISGIEKVATVVSLPKIFSGVDGSILPRPLTIPSVSEPDNPKGLPTAATVSPTIRLDELPSVNGNNFSFGTSSTKIMARSL